MAHVRKYMDILEKINTKYFTALGTLKNTKKISQNQKNKNIRRKQISQPDVNVNFSNHYKKTKLVFFIFAMFLKEKLKFSIIMTKLGIFKKLQKIKDFN